MTKDATRSTEDRIKTKNRMQRKQENNAEAEQTKNADEKKKQINRSTF